MTRDMLFSVLCGMLAAKGRGEALLGNGMGEVRSAFARMMPELDGIHAYFEISLAGERGLDVHCSVEDTVPAGCVPDSADPAWRDALAWFSHIAPVQTKAGRVQLMAEADTSMDPCARPGTYLIHHDRYDLVEPYLAAVRASDRLSVWKDFCARLPKGWKTSYVGLFPGRAGGHLRVNAHQSGAAVRLEEAVAELGLSAGRTSLGLCQELVADSLGYDVQLDLDDRGIPLPDFALEFYLDGALSPQFPWDDGRAERAFACMEARGAADARWRLLVGADVSKRATLPHAGAAIPCAVSLRTFSVKVRFADGKPVLAKAYLRGDACVYEAEPAAPTAVMPK